MTNVLTHEELLREISTVELAVCWALEYHQKRAEMNAAGQATWQVEYPARAVREGHEGRVSYVLTIDESGRVTNCVVAASSGYPLLDEATCRTARRARFEPALDASGSPTTGSWEDTAVYDLR